ncbi:MAG: peroxiredoxin family protein [Aliifodinibius sp.]|nr:peroxiredoxin family protein [Phycisphaerae bacterium]NIT56933.1 peroxiredoxin family protein [Fodinibius sp.]NIY25516.1 peroxiredoxin family protein [Fodinibius sp.]
MSDENGSEKPKKLALIASKGTLDWAYPPFILASAAAAMGWEVGIFFTFYGLTLLLPELEAEVTPLGNPAMPMKLPYGPENLQKLNMPIPTALQSLPGFNLAATTMMKKTFKNKGVATIGELREMCADMGVEMVGCQMTMDVFGFKKEDFIPEATIGGAATFLQFASDADVTLFV